MQLEGRSSKMKMHLFFIIYSYTLINISLHLIRLRYMFVNIYIRITTLVIVEMCNLNPNRYHIYQPTWHISLPKT